MAIPPPDQIERVDSGSGSVAIGGDGLMVREIELKWLISGIESYTQAEEKARDIAPLYYDGHRRTTLSCRPAGGGWYEIAVSYSNTGINAYEGYGITNSDGVKMIPVSLSVDNTGGSEHVTQAYVGPGKDEPGVVSYTAGGGDAAAPDSHGAINISGNSVQGVTKTVPAFNFTETWLVPASYLFKGTKPEDLETELGQGVSDSPILLPGDAEKEIDPGASVPYAKVLHEMTGIVNNDDFRIFKPGEVLFLGARYDTNRNQTMVPVTYSFSVRPNMYDLYIDKIAVRKKPGWHYLWFYYEDSVEQSFFPVKVPKYAYVDQIYEEKSFVDLQIGRSWAQAFAITGQTFTHPLAAAKRGKF